MHRFCSMFACSLIAVSLPAVDYKGLGTTLPGAAQPMDQAQSGVLGRPIPIPEMGQA